MYYMEKVYMGVALQLSKDRNMECEFESQKNWCNTDGSRGSKESGIQEQRTEQKLKHVDHIHVDIQREILDLSTVESREYRQQK